MSNAARQGYQTTCRIEKLKDGNLRLAFSAKLAYLFNKPPGTTYRIRPGLIDSSQNWNALEAKCWVIHSDVLSDNFDATLDKYGLCKRYHIATLEPLVSNADLLEIWDYYVTHNEKRLSLNTLDKLKKHWRNAILDAIASAGKNPLALRNWLIENKTHKTAVETLRTLSRSHELGIKHSLCKTNPFEDMAIELNAQKISNKLEDSHEIADAEIDNSALAYSVAETQIILEAFREQLPGTAANFFEFLFLSGCRVSEAIGIKWSDIKWEKECIVISRQWIDHAQCFAPLKGTRRLPDHKQYRIFPMPKDGLLWKVIEALPRIDNDLNLLFINDNQKPLRRNRVWEWWSGNPKVKRYGVVKKLVAEGKIFKYLSPHHTRHTFNCLQQNVHGIKPEIVASWIGHHPEVNERHYWEVDRRIKPEYGELTTHSSEIGSLKELIKSLQEQLKAQQNLIASLQKSEG